MSIIDELIESQRIVNKVESDYCDILRIPAGASLLQWSYTVRSTWWYKVFEKIDPRFNGRAKKLSQHVTPHNSRVMQCCSKCGYPLGSHNQCLNGGCELCGTVVNSTT